MARKDFGAILPEYVKRFKKTYQKCKNKKWSELGDFEKDVMKWINKGSPVVIHNVQLLGTYIKPKKEGNL